MAYDDQKIKAGRKPVHIVELELDACSLTYGSAPCTASSAAGSECYNTIATCQDTANYTKTTKTYTFSNIPIVAESAIPCIKDISIAPTKLTPGKGIGERASASITFNDFPHSDVGIDPYYSTRNYDPLAQGTFWGKLQARNPYHYSRDCIIKTGYLDDDGRYDAANFQSRYYMIETINGPDSNGRVRLAAKDLLKLADDKTAQCPAPSEGALASGIAAGATSFSVGTGQGADYPTSGKVRINDEVIAYGSRTSDTFSSLTRGDDGTTADSHDAGDSVQLCYVVDAVNVVDVIEDLLTNYADIPSAYINATDWAAEKTDWLGSYDLTRTVTEPTGVNKLLSQIAVECNLDLWWGEIDREIKLKAIVPPRYTTEVINDDYHLLADTVRVKDNEKDRLSQVWFYYGMRNQIDGDDTENYKYLYIKKDADAEGTDKNNKKRIREIKSLWFGASAEALVKTTANRQLARWLNTPKEVEFSLDAKDSELDTGELITLSTKRLQDIDGSNLDYNLAVISKQELIPGTTYKYKAITSQWSGALYAYIAPAGTPDYTSASPLEKSNYGFITEASGFMSNGDEGYNII